MRARSHPPPGFGCTDLGQNREGMDLSCPPAAGEQRRQQTETNQRDPGGPAAVVARPGAIDQIVGAPQKKWIYGCPARKRTVTTFPTMADPGTAPNERESHDCERLSPIK